MPNLVARMIWWIRASPMERLVRRQEACPHRQKGCLPGGIKYCTRCGVWIHDVFGPIVNGSDLRPRMYGLPEHFVRMRRWWRDFRERCASARRKRRQSACKHDWVSSPSVRNYSFGPSENYPEGPAYLSRPPTCRKCGMRQR